MKEREIGVWGVPEWLVDRLGGVALSALAILVPLVMWLGFADGVEFPKHVVFRGLALVLALAVLLQAEGRIALAKHPLLIPLVLLSLFALTSTVMSGAPIVAWSGEDGSWKGSSTLVSVWLGALCAGALARGRLAQKWSAAILVSAVLILVYEMVQALGMDPVTWDPGRRISYWLMASLGNPVHLGNFLVCAFFISLAVFPGRSVMAWLFRGLILAGILATLSRSAVLSLLVGLFVWFIMRRKESRGKGIIMMAAAPAIIIPLLDQIERLFSLTRLIGARPQIWEAALRMSSHYPLKGAGPDLFYSLFPSFAGYSFFSAEPPVVVAESVFLRLPASAHSELFDTMSMLGLPALGLYIWALVVIVNKCRQSQFLPALVALWVGLQVNPSSVANSALFWTMAAIASRSNSLPGKKSARRDAIIAGFMGAVILASMFPVMRLATAQSYRRESGRLLFVGDRAGAIDLQSHWGKYAGRIHPRQAFDDASVLSSDSSADGSARARSMLGYAQAGNPMNMFYVSAAAELDFNQGRKWNDRQLLLNSEAGFRRTMIMAPTVLSLHDDLARVLDLLGRKREADAERNIRKAGDVSGVFFSAQPAEK